MFTQCPDCHAVFRITDEQLRIAHGIVRCGLCNQIFNSLDSLVQEKPTPEPSPIHYEVEQEELELIGDDDLDKEQQLDYAHEIETDEETLESPKIKKSIDPLQTQELEQADLKSDSPESEQEHIPLVEDEFVPTALRTDFEGGLDKKSSDPLSTIALSIGIAALTFILAAQISYLHKIDLIPAPIMQQLCRPLGCKSMPRKDLAAINLLNRNIYSHPEIENGLMITATLINKATFSQPYPMLHVALIDVRGFIVAQRNFAPEEYLTKKEAPNTLMPSNQAVRSQLEVVDPGVDVVGYQIDFL